MSTNTAQLANVRSVLCVPGHRLADWLPGARSSGAGAVLLDLEDSVPEPAKSDALAAVSWAVSSADIVRINHPRAGRLFHESEALRGSARLVMIPKVESAQDIEVVLEAWRPYPLGIIACIESPLAVYSLRSIANSNGLVGLAFGRFDFIASSPIGSADLADRAALEITMTAAALGLHSSDAPCYELDDHGTLLAEAARSRRQGFTSKAAITPSQVGVINRVMGPSLAEKSDAADLLQGQESLSLGAVRRGSRVAAPPTLMQAKRIIASC